MNHSALMDSPRCSAMPPTAEAPSSATISQSAKVVMLVFMGCREWPIIFVRQCYRKKACVCYAIHAARVVGWAQPTPLASRQNDKYRVGCAHPTNLEQLIMT